MALKEITVQELKDRLDRGDRPVILDVREPEEYEESRIEGSLHIPLGDLPGRFRELDKDVPLVVNCRSGRRSARACLFLTEQGFKDVTNLAGGNDAWQALVNG